MRRPRESVAWHALPPEEPAPRSGRISGARTAYAWELEDLDAIARAQLFRGFLFGCAIEAVVLIALLLAILAAVVMLDAALAPGPS